MQSNEWPQEISEKLGSQPFGVWYHDLPMCSPEQMIAQTAETAAMEHDLDCFQSTKGVGEDVLLKGFLSSQICLWLKAQLHEFGRAIVWEGHLAVSQSDP